MASSTVNPLISNQKSSELQAVLHPLVLLTISDYITRHTLREQSGPIVGALLGQQNGREITIEHAFDAHIIAAPEVEGGYLLESERFSGRLEQMKLVHKDRNLDLVGWYAILPTTGPTTTSLPIHNQILSDYNESAVLLGFHPEEVVSNSVGGKLPMTIYESNYEVDEPKTEQEGEDKKMEDGEPALKLRFRELSYTVETAEAEMISMDFVARGGGNATAVEPPKEKAPTVTLELDKKGKRRVVSKEDSKISAKVHDETEDVLLTQEEDEMIASLTAKVNAIKMLHSRIRLITAYLERLPPAYVSGDDLAATPANTQQTTPSNTILRQIQALVSRLDLVTPSDIDAFRKEMLCEQNDVNLVSLLNDVMQSINDVRDVGKKFSVVDGAKNRDRRADFSTLASSPYNLSGAGDILI